MELLVTISYDSEEDRRRADAGWVAEQLQRIWALLGQDRAEIGVRFVSDETMRELNRTYRNFDEPTDILSFADSDSEDFGALFPDELPYVGDLAISLDTLQRNAQSFRVEPNEELLRVLIHGVLHLLGHDHHTNDGSEPMLTEQEALLAQLRRSEE